MTQDNLWSYVKTTAFYALVVAIVVQALFPFYYAIVTSLKTGSALFEIDYFPTSFSLQNYNDVLFKGNGTFIRNFGNSILVASLTVLLALFVAVTAAYALSRVRFRGRSLMLMTILAVSMFPQIAVLAGLFELVRFAGLHNTVWALIFSYTIFTLPFTVWILTTFMRELPVEIEEAAIVDGATPWIIITKVFLPLMWPALVTTGLLAFIAAWNEFLFALTFTSSNEQRTVPVAMNQAVSSGGRGTDWTLLAAIETLFLIPVFLVTFFLQDHLLRGVTFGTVKR